MSNQEKESAVVDIWEVPAGRQQEVIDALRDLLERLRLTDGFIDGRIHVALDGTKVISYSVMRSAADRKAAAEQEDVRERLQALEAIAVPDRNTIELVCVFTARPQGATDFSQEAL